METNVGALKPVVASIRELLQVVRFWEEQQKAFFHGVAELATVLENIARRQGGVLSVVQESSGVRLVTAATRGPMNTLTRWAFSRRRILHCWKTGAVTTVTPDPSRYVPSGHVERSNCRTRAKLPFIPSGRRRQTCRCCGVLSVLASNWTEC